MYPIIVSFPCVFSSADASSYEVVAALRVGSRIAILLLLHALLGEVFSDSTFLPVDRSDIYKGG